MKRDPRALSDVRAESPFATPPRVLVVADDVSAGEAVALVEALDAIGADAEVRFSDTVTVGGYGRTNEELFRRHRVCPSPYRPDSLISRFRARRE